MYLFTILKFFVILNKLFVVQFCVSLFLNYYNLQRMISRADADAQLEAALAAITGSQDPFQSLVCKTYFFELIITLMDYYFLKFSIFL